MFPKLRIITVFLLALFFLGKSPLWGTFFVQSVTINVAIKNGTTDTAARVDKLTLLGIGTGMNTLEERLNVSGNYTFIDSKSSPDMRYLVQAEYKNVKYTSEILTPKPGENISAEVVVYEPTDEFSKILIGEAQYQFVVDDTVLHIVKMFELVNQTSPPRTYINNSGTFKFRISSDSASRPYGGGVDFVTVNAGLVPIDLESFPTDEPDVYAVNYPLKPGKIQISAGYKVSYSTKKYTFSDIPLYRYANFSVVAAPANMEVSGEGLEKARTDTQQDFTVYFRGSAAAGEILQFILAGGSPNPGIRTEGENKVVYMQFLGRRGTLTSIIIFFMLLVFSAYFSRNKSGIPMPDKSPLRGTERFVPRKLQRKREELLQETARMDAFFEAKKISETEYRSQRSNLKRQLTDIYKKIYGR